MSRAQVESLRAILAARPRGEEDVQARRHGFEAFAARFPLPGDVDVQPVTLPDGLTGLRLAPPGARADKAILYLHGGAFVVGSARSHAELASRIARAAGVAAFSLDYRRAPEHTFPSQIDDALAAYAWLRAQGLAPGDIAVAGDSAGGTLAAAMALRLPPRERPGCVALISPYLDLTHSGGSIVGRAARDPFIDTSQMDRTAAIYLGAANPADPLASPLFADLAGFPPVFVQVGEDEVLYDDAARFAARVREAGGEAVFDPWPDMVHVFPFFAQLVDEGAEAAERMGRFIRGKTAAG